MRCRQGSSVFCGRQGVDCALSSSRGAILKTNAAAQKQEERRALVRQCSNVQLAVVG